MALPFVSGTGHAPVFPVVGYERCLGSNCGSRGEGIMEESQTLTEKRKHKRFFPKDWVTAYCQTPSLGIATLEDISMGGAAFRYVEGSRIRMDLVKGPLKLDLFETVTSHGVKQIECRVVYDSEVTNQNDSPGGYRVRRCAVEFGEYDWYQSFQLDMFIKDFTFEGN
jgi:hypothetical protein